MKSQDNLTARLTALEWRATVSLALVFALRMFGMFSILPILAIYAKGLPGGDNQLLIGIALGIDGLAQACLQILFGLLSDRIGRKRMIYIGLALFALGSFIAAGATTIQMIIFGRLVQGTGAISAAVMALLNYAIYSYLTTQGLLPIASIVVATAIQTVLSFFGYRKFAFGQKAS